MIAATTELTPGLVAAGLYVLILFMGGIAVLTVQAVREHGHPPQLGVPAWRARWLDFALWFWCLFMVYLIGGTLVHALVPSQPIIGHQPVDEDPNGLIARSAILEIILLAAQLFLILKKLPFSPAPVNGRSLPPHRIFIEAVLAWLGAFPIIYLTMLGWHGALVILRHWVPDLETPMQDPIRLLAETHQPLALTALLFVAVVLAPMNEELLFRAGLYRFLKAKAGRRVALVVVSLLFALAHANTLNFLGLFVVGLLLARAYERSGNIAVPIIFHGLFNLGNVTLVLLNPDLIKSLS